MVAITESEGNPSSQTLNGVALGLSISYLGFVMRNHLEKSGSTSLKSLTITAMGNRELAK